MPRCLSEKESRCPVEESCAEMEFNQPADELVPSKSRIRLFLERFGLGRFFLRFVDVKIIRFFMVAGLNTAFGWCVFSLLIFIGLHYTLAALIGQVIGIFFNFRTYGALVFRNKELNLLPRFIAVYVLMYLCNVGGMTALKWLFGLNDYVVSAIMCVPVGLLGFVLNKLFVFERVRKAGSGKEPCSEKQMDMKERIELFFKGLWTDKSKGAFYLLCLFGFIFLFWGSFHAGMSGDEEIHNVQAAHVYDFYRTLGKDSTAAVVTDSYNLPLYGQVVDNFAYALDRWFGIGDVMQVRHTVNAICGWIAILFTSLIVFRISGRKYFPAALTFFLFLFSPRFLGHSFNDLKDVNLVTFMSMGLFYMVVFLQDFPKVKRSTIVMLGLSIGLAMAVRVGGLILIAYLGLFGLIRYFALARQGQLGGLSKGAAFWKLVKYGLLASVGGYLLCVLLWPYAMKGPFEHVFGSLSSMNAFAINIRQLFEGRLQWSGSLPWYYTPKFIFMTIPVAVIVGALAALATGWGKGRSFWTFLLLFCFVFPVFWIVYTKANVYGGWRHSMFCYPTLVALAGLGYYGLYQRFSNRYLRWGLGLALPLLLMAGPVRHCVANHPYEYVYFNELAGGIRNAYGKYEMDYYYHSTREGTEWVLAHADTSLLAPGQKFKVATWHLSSVSNYLKQDTAHFRPVFSRIYQMGNNDWDYAVFAITGMNPDWITNAEVFPPVNTAYTVDVDGVPICIVLERKDKSDFYGYQALQQGKLDSAKVFFHRALETNPYNEQALENLAETYLKQGKPDSALAYAARWAGSVPSNTTAQVLLANVYFAQGDISNALSTALRMKKNDPEEISGYWFSAHCYLQQGNMQMALNELQALVRIQPYAPAYQLMARIYQAAGQTAAARQCLDFAARLQ